MIIELEEPYRKSKYKLSVLDNDKSVLPNMLSQGSYEPHIQYILNKIANDYSNSGAKFNFLDIGANFGQHAISVANNYKNAYVCCVEGSANNCKEIDKSIKINNLCNVETFCTILGDGSPANFFSWDENSACSFVSKTEYGNDHHPEHGNIQTPTSSLKNIVSPIFQVIKIDIEGSEKIVLEDSPSIFKGADFCLIEINNFCSQKFFGYGAAENIDLLYSYGYKYFYIFDHKSSSWISISLNTIQNYVPQITMTDILCQK